MRCLYVVGAGKVGNSPGELEDPMVGTSRELQLLHHGFELAVAGLVQRTSEALC